jgi:hypothetical protein
MDVHLILAIFHLFLVVPLFLYVGFMQAATPDYVFQGFLALGVILFLYHGYKAYTRFIASSPRLWVNVFHFALIAPLLIYIGYNEKNTPRPAYELLMIAAFGAGGYHIYNLIHNLNNVAE